MVFKIHIINVKMLTVHQKGCLFNDPLYPKFLILSYLHFNIHIPFLDHIIMSHKAKSKNLIKTNNFCYVDVQ